MAIIALIIIGAAAGFVATRLMRFELDIITTIVLGMVGALIGGLILRALVTVLGFAAGFVGAVLGAIALIWLWKKMQDK